MDILGLRKYCIGVVEKHPELEEEVVGLFNLCISEIEEGGSTPHEIDLCISDVDELVKEKVQTEF